MRRINDKAPASVVSQKFTDKVERGSSPTVRARVKTLEKKLAGKLLGHI